MDQFPASSFTTPPRPTHPRILTPGAPLREGNPYPVFPVLDTPYTAAPAAAAPLTLNAPRVEISMEDYNLLQNIKSLMHQHYSSSNH